MYGDQSKSPINNTTPPVREDVSGVLTTKGSYQTGRKLQAELVDVQLPKRTRSPTIPSPNGNFAQNPASVSDNLKRYQRNLNLQRLLFINFPFTQSAISKYEECQYQVIGSVLLPSYILPPPFLLPREKDKPVHF